MCFAIYTTRHLPSLVEDFKLYKEITGGYLGIFSSRYEYCTQHRFICSPTDFTVPEDAGIEPTTVGTSVLIIRRSNSNNSARSHPQNNYKCN
jgi:hypothetical protein